MYRQTTCDSLYPQPWSSERAGLLKCIGLHVCTLYVILFSTRKPVCEIIYCPDCTLYIWGRGSEKGPSAYYKEGSSK